MKMGLVVIKQVFGFPTRSHAKQPAQLQRLAKKLKLVASLDMILSIEKITKALIRLCRCAGWSVPMLLANPKDRFSYVMAHVCMIKTYLGQKLCHKIFIDFS